MHLCVFLIAISVCYEAHFIQGRQLLAFNNRELSDTSPGHSPGIGHPPKKFEAIKAVGDNQGHSPGIGHPPKKQLLAFNNRELRDTSPGHSPGIGHPPKKQVLAFNNPELRDTSPGHSPGIGHPPNKQILAFNNPELRDTSPGHSPGIGHPPKKQLLAFNNPKLRDTSPGHSPGIGHPPKTYEAIKAVGDNQGHSPGIGHPPKKQLLAFNNRELRDTSPGHSPGIGHPPKNQLLAFNNPELRDTSPGHSPGIGHPPKKYEAIKAVGENQGHSPGIGHPPKKQLLAFNNRELRDTSPGIRVIITKHGDEPFGVWGWINSMRNISDIPRWGLLVIGTSNRVLNELAHGRSQSFCFGPSRLQNVDVAPLRAGIQQQALPARAPGAGSDTVMATLKDILVDHVQYRAIFPKLPGESSTTLDHVLVVRRVEEVRFHLGRIIPDEISQVAINRRVLELQRIANYRVEIDFL
nr:DNA-directed RNA polymerase II subunit RPB1-like [Ipomoea batatas]